MKYIYGNHFMLMFVATMLRPYCNGIGNRHFIIFKIKLDLSPYINYSFNSDTVHRSGSMK